MEKQTVERKKYLDAIGVGRLWRKIRNRYDSKLNSVVAKDDSIAITNGDHIGVQISSDPSNALRLKTITQKGLYVEKTDTYSILQLGVPSQGAKKSYRLQTYDGETGSGSFVGAVIDIPDITEGSTNGSISVGGTNVSVHGLGTAAYTDSSAYDESGSAANVLSSIQALIGANNGIAELNEQGKVPSSQLPSYVDDVREFSSRDDFPLNGESGIIYVDQSVNLPYRWGGSDYVPIGSSLALGETMDTAYRGDRGKAAYDHATAKGNAFASGLYKITTNAEGHVTAAAAVVKSDITDLGVPAQDTTYTFDGAYNAQTNKAATVSTVNTAINNLTPASIHAVPTSQGVENAGKVLMINASGTVEPINLGMAPVSDATIDALFT